MEPLILFTVGLSTGLSGAMIPGPLFLYTVSEAFRSGQSAGIKIALGHLLLEAGFVALVMLGLRDLLGSTAVRTAALGVGRVALIVMGGMILLRVPRLSLSRRADVLFRWGPLAGGAFFSLVSPGFLLWWATIGASVLLRGALAGTQGILAVAAGHATADLGWCWLVAWSVARGRGCCTDRVYRAIMAVIALSLIVMGIGLPVGQFGGCLRIDAAQMPCR